MCDVRASCKAVRRITPPCVATGLCVFVAAQNARRCRAAVRTTSIASVESKAPRGRNGHLAMCGRDGVVRAVPGEGAGPSGVLRSTGTQSDLSETQTPLLCVASDRDGTRVFAAGNTRATREEPELCGGSFERVERARPSPRRSGPGPDRFASRKRERTPARRSARSRARSPRRFSSGTRASEARERMKSARSASTARMV